MKKILALVLTLILALGAVMPACAANAPRFKCDLPGVLNMYEVYLTRLLQGIPVTATLTDGSDKQIFSAGVVVENGIRKALKLVLLDGGCYATEEGLVILSDSLAVSVTYQDLLDAFCRLLTGCTLEEIASGELTRMPLIVLSEIAARLPLADILTATDGSVTIDLPLLAESLAEALPEVLQGHAAELDAELARFAPFAEIADIDLPENSAVLIDAAKLLCGELTSLAAATGRVTLTAGAADGTLLALETETGIFAASLTAKEGGYTVNLTAGGTAIAMDVLAKDGVYACSLKLNGEELAGAQLTLTQSGASLLLTAPGEKLDIALDFLASGYELTLKENDAELLKAVLTLKQDGFELVATSAGSQLLTAQGALTDTGATLTWNRGGIEGSAVLTLTDADANLVITESGKELLNATGFVQENGFTLYATTPKHTLYASATANDAAVSCLLTLDGKVLADAHLAAAGDDGIALSAQIGKNTLGVTLSADDDNAYVSVNWNEHCFQLRAVNEDDSTLVSVSMDTFTCALSENGRTVEISAADPEEEFALNLRADTVNGVVSGFLRMEDEEYTADCRQGEWMLQRTDRRGLIYEYTLTNETPAEGDALNVTVFRSAVKSADRATGGWRTYAQKEYRFTTEASAPDTLTLTAENVLTGAKLFTLTLVMGEAMALPESVIPFNAEALLGVLRTLMAE